MRIVVIRLIVSLTLAAGCGQPTTMSSNQRTEKPEQNGIQNSDALALTQNNSSSNGSLWVTNPNAIGPGSLEAVLKVAHAGDTIGFKLPDGVNIVKSNGELVLDASNSGITLDGSLPGYAGPYVYLDQDMSKFPGGELPYPAGVNIIGSNITFRNFITLDLFVSGSNNTIIKNIVNRDFSVSDQFDVVSQGNNLDSHGQPYGYPITESKSISVKNLLVSNNTASLSLTTIDKVHSFEGWGAFIQNSSGIDAEVKLSYSPYNGLVQRQLDFNSLKNVKGVSLISYFSGQTIDRLLSNGVLVPPNNSDVTYSPGYSQLTSANGQCRAVMQNDGNFVIYAGGPTGTSVIWNSFANAALTASDRVAIGNDAPYMATLSSDGNFSVMYHEKTLMQSGTAGQAVMPQLVLTNDCDLVLSDISGTGNDVTSRRIIWTARHGLADYRLPSKSNEIRVGEGLGQGDRITSPDGRFSFTITTDGVLGLYDSTKLSPILFKELPLRIWQAGNGGSKVAGKLVVQNDGNVILYDPRNRPILSSNTFGHSQVWVALQNDGNVVVNDVHGFVTSLTNTGGSDTYPTVNLLDKIAPDVNGLTLPTPWGIETLPDGTKVYGLLPGKPRPPLQVVPADTSFTINNIAIYSDDVLMQYDLHYDYLPLIYDSDFFNVEVSTDNGVTWAVAQTFPDGPTPDDPHQQVFLKPLLLGAHNLQIRFHLKLHYSNPNPAIQIKAISLLIAPPQQ